MPGPQPNAARPRNRHRASNGGAGLCREGARRSRRHWSVGSRTRTAAESAGGGSPDPERPRPPAALSPRSSARAATVPRAGPEQVDESEQKAPGLATRGPDRRWRPAQRDPPGPRAAADRRPSRSRRVPCTLGAERRPPPSPERRRAAHTEASRSRGPSPGAGKGRNPLSGLCRGLNPRAKLADLLTRARSAGRNRPGNRPSTGLTALLASPRKAPLHLYLRVARIRARRVLEPSVWSVPGPASPSAASARRAGRSSRPALRAAG